MGFVDRALKLDRRWIFLGIAVCTAIPLVKPLGVLKTRVTPTVRGVYDKIDTLKPGDRILVSLDFDPASKPELEPMAVAILRHAFAKKLRIVTMTLWVSGRGLAGEVVNRMATEAGAEYGKDYCYLGYMVGNQSVVAQMSTDISATFPKDSRGNETRYLPILQGISALRDFEYVVSVAAGDPGVDTWVIYGQGTKALGGGCTAVSVSQYLTYYQSGQITGLLGALKGAAEYEVALGRLGEASQRMEVQAFVHFYIILLVVLCNVFYFLSRKKG